MKINVLENCKGYSLDKHICFITPINFAHRAGDGKNTKHHNCTHIHPALQANCGGTQMTFLLERWKKNNI